MIKIYLPPKDCKISTKSNLVNVSNKNSCGDSQFFKNPLRLFKVCVRVFSTRESLYNK